MKRLAAAAALLALLCGASILPPGTRQFTDSNGQPLVGGTVCLYVTGTTTPKQTWQDQAQSVPNTTPCVTLDAAGRAVIWGYGQYREIVYDQFGTLQWDKNVTEYVSDVQNNAFNYGGGATTPTTNTFQIVVAPVPPAYVAGQRFQFIPPGTNTGPSTLNVDNLGARNIYKVGLTGPGPLAGNELIAGNLVEVMFDGSEFQILSTTPTNPSGVACGDSSGIGFWDSCNQTWTKAQRGGQAAVTISTSTFTPDLNAEQHFTIVLNHAACPCTIANPTSLSGAVGQVGILVVQQSATGSDTVSWGADYKWPGGTAPTLSTAANAIDIFPYYVESTTDVLMGTGGQNYAP